MSGRYCNSRNVGSHMFWKDKMEPKESNRLVCARTVNPELKLDHKHGCRNCLLTASGEFVVL